VHVDSNPLIHEGRVYGGSGTSQKNKVNRIFCLEVATGNEVWSEKVEFSAWAAPSAMGKYVYFATGNGTYSEDKPPIAGLVLCREATTGKPIWERALPNSVVAKPALDRYQAYVGCRDGKVYALDRFTGDIVWSQMLNSPVLAAPTIVKHPEKHIGEVLYVMGVNGLLLALAPQDGGAYWGMELRALVQKGHINAVAIPAAVREQVDGKLSRRIVVGLGFGDTAAATPTGRVYCFRDVNGD
jgi:outer membrane protein assembly factor BamB